MKSPNKLLLSAIVVSLSIGALSGQSSPTPPCNNEPHHLHAALSSNPSYSDPKRIVLNFSLMNDSERALDSSVRSWKLVIDGKTSQESDMLFGNGLGPVGGFGTVPLGTTFQFNKELPLDHYFPEDKTYTVYWVSDSFKSNTVTFHGGPVKDRGMN